MLHDSAAEKSSRTPRSTWDAFNFENARRNTRLLKKEALGSGISPSSLATKFTKTGTTIVGAVYSGGVVLGADTRATNGPLVADKNCEKIHFIAPNIMCCGAGTAADTEKVTALVAAKLTLQRLSSGRQSRVLSCLNRLKNHLYRYQGHVSAALVLGGCDVRGPYLGTVAPHGSTDRLPFVSMGSGCLAAMAVLENRYEDGMDEEKCKALVGDAVAAGIFNDLGSGSCIDLCVLRVDGTVVTLRNVKDFNKKLYEPARHIEFTPGTTTVLREDVRCLVVEEAVQPVA